MIDVLGPCEWPEYSTHPCDRKATRIASTGRMDPGYVMCDQHAEIYLADNRSPDPDDYAECQFDTGHPGGICGARCDGATYCRAHRGSTGPGSSWSIRENGRPLVTTYPNDDPWTAR